MNKNGLSGVVTTLIVIVISIVLIASVGLLINNFVNKQSAEISMSKFVVEVKVKSAYLDYPNSTAVLRIKRELGSGDLVGIKFIFADDKNSEVFDRYFVGFNELEERTFSINVSENSTLSLYEIDSVSIAPIIRLESGKEVVGKISDGYSGLGYGFGNVTQEEEEPGTCQKNSDCGVDYLLTGTEYCDDQSNVNQYKKVFTCTLGFCYNGVVSVLISDCPELCFDGQCIEAPVACTPENVTQDCGADGFIGAKGCAQNNTLVVQDYKDFECVNSTCEVTVTSRTVDTCVLPEVCFGGECFIPLECTKNSDCQPGKLCVQGKCVDEVYLSSGGVYSIWPFGIGEYFDSPDLPNPSNLSYIGKYVVFPGSLQEGCLKITEHKKPNLTNAYSYVRLNETITNISNGDSYTILETNYFCSVL